MASQKWQAQAPYEGLSKRAVEILGLLSEGMSDREIAERLVMTINTVKWYNRQIYGILGVGSRTQAIARARELQLLDEDNEAAPSIPPVRRLLKHKLPAETTRFIGRTHEIEQIRQLLDTTHLLTLVGPPGTGKTRLALQAAWAVADTFQDGAYFVSLAPINDPALVANTIASVIGINETQEQPLLETLKHFLRQSRLLLILDNFEHLLSAATQVSELLAAAPGLKVLATSREPLHLYGEQEYTVPPLELPDLENLDLEALADCESTALFMQQARAVRPNFALTAENGLDIAQICVRLEGLPLAIELAAARTKLLTPQTLLSRLVSRLDTLTGGAKDLPARQQTLHNTIEWSYNLLNDGEKMLFARLSVFRGDFSLEAVETICCEDLPIDVFDGLESLVNKSLIQQKALPDGEPRFTMLETLHEYAWEQLRTADFCSEMSSRHSAYYFDLVTCYEASFFGMESQSAVAAVRYDLDNIRQSWQWAVKRLASERTATNPDLIATFHKTIDGLAAFYEAASLFEEGLGAYAHAVEEMTGGGQEAEAARCHLLARMAEFAEWRGNDEQAYRIAMEALQLAERLNLPLHRADGLRTLGILKREKGELEQAIYHLQEAISIYQSLEAKRPLAIACDWLGLLYSDLRRIDEAMDYLGQAAAIYADTGNERGIIFNKGMTAIVLSIVGRLREAVAYQRAVLTGYQKFNNPFGEARTSNNLGLFLMELGELEEAAAKLEYAVQMNLQIGDVTGFYNAVGNKGEVHLALEAYDDARNCFQQAGPFFNEQGMSWLESENLWRLGWLLTNIGEYEQAQAALEGCLSLVSAEENPEAYAMAHGLLGEIAWQLGSQEQALAHFDRAAETFKSVRRHLTVARFAIIRRATLLLERDEIGAAEAALAELRPLLGEAGRNPVGVESGLLQAKIKAATGSLDEAQKQLEDLLSTNLRLHEQAAVHYELWHLTKNEEHGHQALIHYQQLADRSPNLTYRRRITTLRTADPFEYAVPVNI